MGRVRGIPSLQGRRRRRRRIIKSEDESSDEEYLVGEKVESDGDSVSRLEVEVEVEPRNSCWVSGALEEEDDEGRNVLESKHLGAFAGRRKRSSRKSRVFWGCGREVGSDEDWNLIQERPRTSFSAQRNLKADRFSVVTVEGNMMSTTSQMKPMKEFLGEEKSRDLGSPSIRGFLKGEDEDEIEPIAQSKAIRNSWVRKDSLAWPCSNRVSDDEEYEEFRADAEEHVQNQEEKKARGRRRRAAAYSESYCFDQISPRVEDIGSEEAGDSTKRRDRSLKRLQADVSWNHLRQKRSVRQSHGVRRVSDHEAFKPNADGHVDDDQRHWVRKNKRVQLPLSAYIGAVGSSDAIGVEYEALKAEQKKMQRRKRQMIVFSDESEDSESVHTAAKGMVVLEDRDLSSAANGCENFTTSLCSSVSRRLQVGLSWNSLRRRRFRKKGTRKAAAAGMQVCGICLSEEHNDIIRGMLDSCSHYFCFTCIMEWSKVETRCPVCKQRFMTITKPARWEVGVCPVKEVITIPERNQVYQPSEEEVRSYFDPYENVVCMECQEGDNGNLLLLCDICDSAAHTYCVGLGLDVPEDSWYCNSCMPTDPSPSGAQALDDIPSSSLHGLCIEHPGDERVACLESDAQPFMASQHSIGLSEHPFSTETVSMMSGGQRSNLIERPAICI